MIRSFLDPDEVAFLDDVEEFFSARPTDPFGFYHGRGGDARRLYQELGARGWLSLGWPVEVGGAAKPPTYDFIVWNTSARHRAARPDLGPGIIAHVLTVYGTEDQQARYLPGLATGSTCFALGYSEPEAGSDLTGLRTRALVDGDNYVVSGEKCWTSDAHHSDYLWLLCRTGSLEDRGRALTLLIVDMHAPGVTVTPIETIDGHRLNQVFLDGVVVPSFDRVGAEGAAWTIIREALAVERHLQLLPGRLERDLADLRCVLERSGRLADRQGAAVFAELTARFRQVEASSMVTLAELCAGRPAVEAAARTKFLGTRLAQAIPRAAIDLCGADALDLAEPMPFLWRQSFMETIAGGTSEVMLSIMARGELGLELAHDAGHDHVEDPSVRTLSFSVEQDEFAASVAATVERFGAGVAVGGDRVWCELGAIGLLGIGTPDGGGTMIDLVAGMRAAGATGCQGPFLGAVLGTRILPDLAGAIADGTAHVSLVAGGVAAWAADATAFVAIDDAGDAARVEVISSTPFDTLAHEPWARVDVRRLEPLAVTAHDLAAVELARAAWLVGAARTAVERSADHARDRMQFGRAIGDFQAVAHQLAEAAAEVGAAWDATVVAAWQLEREGDTTAAVAASSAATRAGLIAAYASHQVHGALGYTVESGLDRLSTGIRQMSVHPPSPAMRERVVVAAADAGGARP